MSNKELKLPAQRTYDWSFDPIKSFREGEEGEQNKTFIMTGFDEKPISDPILWEAGKRAFDVVRSKVEDGEITTESFKELRERYPSEMVKVFNSMKEMFDKLITDGRLILLSEAAEPITELPPITVDPRGFWAHSAIEPSLVMLDDICEQQCLQMDIECFPYDRELLAAYFTLSHLDTTLIGVSFGDAGGLDYDWVTHWFEKIDAYNRTKRNIELRDECQKRRKSQSMNSGRHAKRNEAVQLVTQDWSKRKSEFRSAEKAGVYYADWLEARGHEYEPRTITNWIRKYAKDNGIKLR
ncbi:hypothetical protein [Marinobacter qingdaonensis]|uniref:Uncharacterized protein n=1 Tax=Marinobacter qingdaonensis TaxID=3108486 RepID=A0ABU5P1R7_9GAMM|nr:hypothetical protein [Marinobacter sp. ASW11-75]MEA1081979.1 hypothetical protein [Marinobacter sp. ASW11-75]